jgi:hypothetical protein
MRFPFEALAYPSSAVFDGGSQRRSQAWRLLAGAAAADCRDGGNMKRNLAAAMGRWRWKTFLGAALIAALVGGVAYGHGNPFPEGWMTGGGNFMCGDIKVTHGFELRCSGGPNNLEINWGVGNNFHLDALTAGTVDCFDDPAFAPPPPPFTTFDTFSASGTGSFNNVSGYSITFILTDHGEPGTSDTITFTIFDPSGAAIFTCGEATLENGGNHQAHEPPQS